MKVVAAVASCISVGLVLQGCGGSTTTCLSEKPDLVSQTLKGKIDVSADATYGGMPMSDKTQIAFTLMLDFEKFNMRFDASGKAPDGTKMTGTAILDMEKMQVVDYDSSTQNCSIAKIPEGTFPPAAQLKIMLDTFKPLLADNAVCGGNDGTYDTWKFGYNFTGDLPPIPIPDISDDENLPSLDGLKIKDGSVTEDLVMSKDQLLHSSNTHVSGELLNGTESLGSLKMTASLSVDEAKSGGPAKADLDPSKFDVECTVVPFDVAEYGDGKPAHAARGQPAQFGDGTSPRSLIHQRLFRIMKAMKASKNSEHALIV